MGLTKVSYLCIQEKKRAALSDLSRQLQSQLDRRREEVEARSRRDKQNFYQTLFERDMEAHKQSRLQHKTQGTDFSTSYISKYTRKISSGINFPPKIQETR